MCPNCNRGLTANKEVCQQCAGTGFWNPASLSVNEVNTMNDTETVVAPAEEVIVPTEEVAAPEAAPVEEVAPAADEAAAE